MKISLKPAIKKIKTVSKGEIALILATLVLLASLIMFISSNIVFLVSNLNSAFNNSSAAERINEPSFDRAGFNELNLIKK